mmetsp:Transcript_22844/g.34074  ORF Transcript_22844/g.34074 Transcript_22844/m.34074 type:complete len:272 (+) Transcript_22844:809-1624(+)
MINEGCFHCKFLWMIYRLFIRLLAFIPVLIDSEVVNLGFFSFIKEYLSIFLGDNHIPGMRRVRSTHENCCDGIRNKNVSFLFVGQFLNNWVLRCSSSENMQVTRLKVNRSPRIYSFVRYVPFAKVTTCNKSFTLIHCQTTAQRGKFKSFDKFPIFFDMYRWFALALVSSILWAASEMVTLPSFALSTCLTNTPTPLRRLWASAIAVVESSSGLWKVFASFVLCFRLRSVVNQCERRLVIFMFVVEYIVSTRELLLIPPWILLRHVPVRYAA